MMAKKTCPTNLVEAIERAQAEVVKRFEMTHVHSPAVEKLIICDVLMNFFTETVFQKALEDCDPEVAKRVVKIFVEAGVIDVSFPE